MKGEEEEKDGEWRWRRRIPREEVPTTTNKYIQRESEVHPTSISSRFLIRGLPEPYMRLKPELQLPPIGGRAAGAL